MSIQKIAVVLCASVFWAAATFAEQETAQPLQEVKKTQAVERAKAKVLKRQLRVYQKHKAAQIKTKRRQFRKEYPVEVKEMAYRHAQWAKEHPKEARKERLQKQLRYAHKIGDEAKAAKIEAKMAGVIQEQRSEKQIQRDKWLKEHLQDTEN